MHYFKIIASLLLSALTVVSADSIFEDEQDPVNYQNPFEVSVGFPNGIVGADGSIQVFSDEDSDLTFSVKNGADQPVTVVGFTGSFKDIKTDEVIANLSTVRVGPYKVEVGSGFDFTQPVNLRLEAKTYNLYVDLVISYEDQYLQVTRVIPNLIIEERPISFFDPQFLTLLTLLLASIGVLSYFAATTFLVPYLTHNQLLGFGKNTAPKVSVTKTAKVTPATSSALDESWLPEQHLKQIKKGKKAN